MEGYTLDQIDYVRASRAFSRLEFQLKLSGLEVEMGNDFLEFTDIVDKIKGKHSVTENFSCEQNTFTPRQAVWFCLRDEDGIAHGVQALRFDDLVGTTLAHFLKRYWERIYAARSHTRPAMSRVQPRFLAELTGPAVYCGDLFVDRSIRGTGVASIFSKIALIVALQNWNPDFVYAFNEQRTAERGFAVTLGYKHIHEIVPRWDVPPSQISGDFYLIWTRRNDILDMIDVLSGDYELAKTGQPRLAVDQAGTAG